MKKILILFCCLLLWGVAEHASGQVFSTKGKEFWCGFMENRDDTTSNKNISILISSEAATRGTVSVPSGGWSSNFTVTANSITTIIVPYQYLMRGTGTFNTAVKISAADSVSVFASNYVRNSFDATVVIPIQSLGKEYRAITGPAIGLTEILVVATKDSTQYALVSPSGTTLASGTLQQGQLYQYQDFSDLTGTIVRSTNCKNIAVFSGNICTYVPENCFYCDHLYEQMFPIPSWGKTFVVPSLALSSVTMVKVVASLDNTVITYNDGSGNVSVNLSAGGFWQSSFSTPSLYITATNPVAVGQFAEGSTCAHVGDPFLMWISSTEQGRKSVTYTSIPSPIITSQFVNVVLETSDRNSLTLNGISVPPSSFITLPQNPTWSYALLQSIDGANTLTANENFIAYVYGFGSDESYGYSAGSEVRNLSTSITNTTPVCTGRSVSFSATVPSDITVITFSWSFGDGGTSALQNPQYTYSSGGNFSVKYYFTYAIGTCPGDIVTDSIVKTITVYDVNANAGPDTTICDRTSASLHATGGTSFVWNPATGLSDPNIPNPIATPSATITYTVIVSSGGCIDTDQVVVTVNPNPTANAGSDVKICSGDSVQLSATGGDTYRWIPATGLSDATSQSPMASPAATTIYSVIVTSGGCSDTDDVLVDVTERARYTPSVHIVNYDTVICDDVYERKIVLRNTGTMIAHVRAVLTGTMFSIGPDTFDINVAGNDTLIVRFQPTSTGSFSGLITLSGDCAIKDTIVLRGVKAPTPTLAISPATIFPETYCGISRDTIIVVRNTGVQTITLRASLTDTSDFTIVFPKTPVTLAPGDSVRYTIRFLPNIAGNDTTTFIVEGSLCSLRVTTSLRGTCTLEQVTVFFPNETVVAGLRTRIPLTASQPIQPDYTEFSVLFSFDSTVVFIHEPLPAGTASENASIQFSKPTSGSVRYQVQSSSPLPKVRELAAFDVEALYGKATSTILRIDSLGFKQTPLSLQSQNGSLSVSGCDAGQFTTSGQTVLEQNSPNPFSRTTTIKYSVPAGSNPIFVVSNLLGTVIAKQELNAGANEFHLDAGTLSAGTYIYSLFTAKSRVARVMTVMK